MRKLAFSQVYQTHEHDDDYDDDDDDDDDVDVELQGRPTETPGFTFLSAASRA